MTRGVHAGDAATLFTWDGAQEDFRLGKLGFLSSVNDVTHHGKFTAATKLQNNTRRHGGAQSGHHTICRFKIPTEVEAVRVTAKTDRGTECVKRSRERPVLLTPSASGQPLLGTQHTTWL